MMTDTAVPPGGKFGPSISNRAALVIGLFPCAIFFLNGILVNTLKYFTAPVELFWLMPIAILLGAIAVLVHFKLQFRDILSFKYIVVLVVPAIFAVAHHYYYGTSLGTDSASYFTNPVQSFEVTGHFSFSEDPFRRYGDQPLANYWIIYNTEFLIVGLSSLFNTHFIHTVALMHVTSNYLLGLALFLVLARMCDLFSSIALFVAILLLVYSTQHGFSDYAATSVFRGFENKGLVYGYFFWLLVLIAYVPSGKAMDPPDSIAIGVLFAGGSFMTSGNALFLAIPLLPALLTVGWRTDRRETFLRLTTVLLGFLVGLTVFKLLETTDVYKVVTPELTLREAPDYQSQKKGFMLPWRLWALATALIILCAVRNRCVAIQLTAYCLFALFVKSELFYNIFAQIAPERMLNFWRGVILFNPFVPIAIAAGCLVSITPFRWAVVVTYGICAILVGVILSGTLKFPNLSPFRLNRMHPELVEIANSCQKYAVVLANRHDAVLLPVVEPTFGLLVGREYFLHWQIANLVDQPIARQRALNVRDASLYLSISPVTRKYMDNPDGLMKTITTEDPDIIFTNSTRFGPGDLYLFNGYERSFIGRRTVFSKPGVCSFREEKP